MGSLPFTQIADVLNQDGIVVEAIAISPVWPVNGFNAQTGAQYDHEAEAEIDGYPALSVSNASVRVEGRRYRVIQAQRNDYLPHVALSLRYINPGGGGG
jgi:hypothetical protein